MKTTTYFEKYGEIYGIEQPDWLCGYSTQCIKFTNIEEAQRWVNERKDVHRFLGTKADAKHANLRR